MIVLLTLSSKLIPLFLYCFNTNIVAVPVTPSNGANLEATKRAASCIVCPLTIATNSKLPLNKYIVSTSGIRKFFDLANEMEGVISLGVGEPDFDTPWKIREAAIYSIEQGKTFSFIIGTSFS